jgi:hypothetical protein
MYGVIVSESSMNKYNIFADPLGFEIKNRAPAMMLRKQ